MFKAAFHTGYVRSHVMILTKGQLDSACDDERFDDNFFLELIFEARDEVTIAPGLNDGPLGSSDRTKTLTSVTEWMGSNDDGDIGNGEGGAANEVSSYGSNIGVGPNLEADMPYFIKSETFHGRKDGYVFRSDEFGTGYYFDDYDHTSRSIIV